MPGNENSGRKTDNEIVAHYLKTELANDIHNEELEKLKQKEIRTLDEMKVLVTPITIKGIKETSDVNLKIGGTDLEKYIEYATKTNQSIPQNKVDDEAVENSAGRNFSEQDL